MIGTIGLMNILAFQKALFIAAGGTVTYDGDYTIHTFTSSGTLEVLGNSTLEVLVVAGGGGGGSFGGGGGAGGLIHETANSITTGSYTVTIGAGGAGQPTYSSANPGSNGQNSSFNSLVAIGGGGGGSRGGASTYLAYPGVSGGSGGGSSNGNSGSPAAPGSGTIGQGNAGGTGRIGTAPHAGAGGGGAGQTGFDGTISGAGDGGDGLQISISGTPTYYAGGGAGTIYTDGGTAGVGGLGGGGSSATSGVGQAGTPNTGGGGASGAVSSAGGAGGSGVVIIRYKTPTISELIAEGGTTSKFSNYNIHAFTSSGNLTVYNGGLADILIIGGGGAGGSNDVQVTATGSGGGGAGGLIYRESVPLSAGVHAVTVGSGGSPVSDDQGGSGGNSVFYGITAIGGGGGGQRYSPNQNGVSGGSGGGSGYQGTGGSGTSGQGNSGGSGTASQTGWCGAGGGGAGSAGVSPTLTANIGTDGGSGLYYGDKFSDTFGSTGYFAGGGGGGGGTDFAGGSGQAGGGSGITNSDGSDATPNTGSGGGGSANGHLLTAGGSGASGIVIIRYPKVATYGLPILDGLVIYLDANLYSGSGPWLDLSGYGNNCNWNSQPTHNTTHFTFNGTSNYGTITANQNELNFSTAQTVMILMRHSYTSGSKNPWNQAYGGYGTWTHESGNYFNMFCGDAGSNTTPYISTHTNISPPNPARNVWNSVASSRNTSDIRAFVNGSHINTTTHTYGTLATTTANILIGDGYVDPWAGDMMVVLAYNRDLSTAEILQNHNYFFNRYGL